MHVGVVGAGALGLYYGAMLQRAGHTVSYLLRSDYQALNAAGLTVHSINGDFYLPEVRGYRTAEEIGPVDLVLVGLKTFANHCMIDLVRPLVGAQTMILTLQNGLGNEELLADAFSPQTVLGGIAFLCSNRGEPGHVHHLGEGRIRLGEFSGGDSERSRMLADEFSRAGVPCQAVTDLRKARWEKLIWNIPFNGLCALLNQNVNLLLWHASGKQLAGQIMEEVVAAGNAQSLSKPIDGAAFIPRMIGMTEQMDNYCPSMMIDRQQGRPLELEAIYRIPLRMAAQKGVAMPKTEMLCQLLDMEEHQ